MAFVAFRHKSNGVVAYYPEHFAGDPVLGADLELYNPDEVEYEEDKVVIEGHELPVEQRARIIATPLDELHVDELKDIAKEHGLPVSGTKAELIERIANDVKETSNAD